MSLDEHVGFYCFDDMHHACKSDLCSCPCHFARHVENVLVISCAVAVIILAVYCIALLSR